VAGTAELGNSTAIANLTFLDKSANVRIGGTNPSDRNLISGNGVGIHLSSSFANALVQGNYLGTDRGGTTALQNANFGILIFSSGGHKIGGTAAGAGNLISGNGQWGIQIGDPYAGIVIQGNLIGTNATGDAVIPNPEGIRVNAASTDSGGRVLIGGTAAGAGNVISGNVGGLFLDNRFQPGGAGNTVQGNFIGTDRTGTLDLHNSNFGVILDGTNHTLGGPEPGAANVIAFTTGSQNQAGVEVGGLGNSILTNSIFAKGGKGIMFLGGAPNSPFLTSASGTSIAGTLNSTASTTSEGLDAAIATDRANYRLVAAGPDGRLGTRDDRRIRLGSASYDPVTRTVTLGPVERLRLRAAFGLTVRGTAPGGLRSALGNLLDGDNDGRAGGHFTGLINQSMLAGPASALKAGPGAASARRPAPSPHIHIPRGPRLLLDYSRAPRAAHGSGRRGLG